MSGQSKRSRRCENLYNMSGKFQGHKLLVAYWHVNEMQSDIERHILFECCYFVG